MRVQWEGGPYDGVTGEFDPLSDPGPCGLWDGRLWTATTEALPLQLPYAQARVEVVAGGPDVHVFRLLPALTLRLARWAYVDKGTIDLPTYELVVGWALAAEAAARDLPDLPVFDWRAHQHHEAATL